MRKDRDTSKNAGLPCNSRLGLRELGSGVTCLAPELKTLALTGEAVQATELCKFLSIRPIQ